LCAACPEAIVDFDITEGRRFVGLGFLSAGKYFLLNNGPYFPNYDLAYDRSTTWSNIFVRPGPARGWICRTPLTFDKWIPSVLFLTHYLPDDPESSQVVNIGSLILGQNGIWGDLLGVSEEGVARLGAWLGLYKQVRDDITRSDLVRVGVPGGSPEIYEKIDAATGRGAVVAFASAAGGYSYVTRHVVSAEAVATPGVDLRRDAQGCAVLRFTFEGAGAHFVFFGAQA
jgi:alpha-galactosidase